MCVGAITAAIATIHNVWAINKISFHRNILIKNVHRKKKKILELFIDKLCSFYSQVYTKSLFPVNCHTEYIYLYGKGFTNECANHRIYVWKWWTKCWKIRIRILFIDILHQRNFFPNHWARVRYAMNKNMHLQCLYCTKCISIIQNFNIIGIV